MSPDEGPGLRAVTDDEAPPQASAPAAEFTGSAAAVETAATSEPSPQEPRSERRGSWLSILLLLALVAACLGYLYEDQRARNLETQLTAAQTELLEAQQALQGHEQRMQVVRGHVDDLAARFQLLQQAVEADPE